MRKMSKQPDSMKDLENAPSIPVQKGDVIGLPAAFSDDAVFGEITEDGPNYRNVCIQQTSCFR